MSVPPTSQAVEEPGGHRRVRAKSSAARRPSAAIPAAAGIAGAVGVGAVLHAAGTPLPAVGLAAGAVLVLGLYAALSIRSATRAAAAARGSAVVDDAVLAAADADGAALAVSDGAGRILYRNAAWSSLFGPGQPGEASGEAGEQADVGAVLENRFGDPSRQEDAFEDPVASVMAAAYQGRSARVALRGEGPRQSAPIFDLSAEPLPGGLTSWRLRDVSENRRSADRLGDRLALLSRALDRAPFGLLLLDGEAVVREANATMRDMLGSGLVTGRPVASLFHEEDADRIAALVEAALADGEAAPADIRPAGAAAALLTLHATRAAVTRAGGGGVLLHAVDATERRRLEMQFAQSQKMQALGQLAGGVAHDFNNMLTAMIGFCDLVLQRHHQGEQTFADIMQIKQNANRAAGLVRQLLAFSRQQAWQPRLVTIADVLGELSALLSRVLGESIELRLQHGRDVGLVRTDQSQLEQVIINLAVNARDAMPRGGRLTITTDSVRLDRPRRIGAEQAPAGDYVTVAVSDTGEGVPKEIQDRIFEPFFTTKEVGAGTGLGLSMVYGSVKQMNGFVTVDSDGPGEGATFTLYIPQVDPTSAAVAADGEAAEIDAARDVTGGGEVLLVEDEDPVRLFSARALRSKGYVVTEARTGAAALELLAEKSFDLLVTDMVMPEVDGPTLIRRAREDRPDLPVVCISGYTQEAVAREISALPRVFFLPKPFSLKQLATKVKTALDSAL